MRGKVINGSSLWLLRDGRRARRQCPVALTKRLRAFLAKTVAFARANSPCHRELYQGLLEWAENVAMVPITDEKRRMARFDDWTTKCGVTQEDARQFVDIPDLLGK